MDNNKVAAVLDEVAELLDLAGESVFCIRAYRRAAQAVKGLSEELTSLDAKGQLTDIPGIGPGITERLHELW